jgi:hypothetical protein
MNTHTSETSLVVANAASEAAAENLPALTDQIDLDEVKSMLDLPGTATDLELITVLVNLVATLQEKYEGLLQDAVAMEETVVNRDLADFRNVLDEATAPFWKEQLIHNRTMALEALTALKQRVETLRPVLEPRVIPLRNRLAAVERTIETVAETPSVDASRKDAQAFRIRNRAHEIAKADQVPFIVAFARAENEIKSGE